MPRCAERCTPTIDVFLACLLALAVVAGCGAPLTPEHKAALLRVEELGGKVNFKRGGYGVTLSGTYASDDDLVQLQHIANLKSVDLRGTRITDKGIAHLRAITTLESVRLERTLTSREAVNQLKTALPKATVDR